MTQHVHVAKSRWQQAEWRDIVQVMLGDNLGRLCHGLQRGILKNCNNTQRNATLLRSAHQAHGSDRIAAGTDKMGVQAN